MLPSLQRGVEIERVAFSYPGGRTALEEVSLDWPAGSCLGISGPSGSGKSTLLRLLARLARPERGRILFDFEDLNEVEDASLRALVGATLQPPELLHGTLRENLTLGADVEHCSLASALDATGLGEVAAGLPHGLETPLGEGGERLSSGQLTRLGLARLFLAPRPVLLLDEPTSSLDAATAERIVDALRRLRVGRTVCLVSHDPRVLALCDRVLHLRQGRVDPR